MKNIYKIIIAVFVVAVLGIIIYSMDSETVVEKVPPVSTGDSIVGCYVAHLQKDIYTLVIQSEEKGAVFGMLAYNNYQKDSSSGSFEGTFTDGILLGNYSFDSEGMRSDRQLIFKQVDGNFIEGFGDVKMVDGKEVFVDTNNINYDQKLTFVKSKDCAENFSDSNNIFTFDYNPYFKAYEGQNILDLDWRQNTTKKGVLLASVVIPKTYMPNTNFSSARFTIGRSTDANEIKNCMTSATNGEKKGEATTISGYDFVKFSLDDAGAGNFYETTSYRGIVDGDCYAIEYTIHSTNIGNYSPSQGIIEFDKSVIQNEIGKIIKSFKFLINSD